MNSSAKSADTLLKLLFAIEYSPKKKKADIHFRAQHSFLHVISGYCEYRTARESIKIESGDIAYLPKGAAYSYEFFDGCYCRQIEFDAGNVKFTDKKFPIKLASTDSNKALIASIVQKAESLRQSDGLLVLGNLYTLCSLIPETGNRLSKNSRIEPAVDYINEHFCEKFSISTLAELCFMSEAQLRRYFKSELNTTPIEYKNRLRIEKAKSILLYDIADVSQTAEKLGFDNVYAFSTMFKKTVGRSPTDFAKLNKKADSID